MILIKKRALAGAALSAGLLLGLSCAAWADFELPQVDKADWDTSEAVEQTIDFEAVSPDFRLGAMPERGQVSLDYFNTATFLGDSLTQGLEIYDTGLPNATYCAYKGAGPNSVVNGATCTRANGSTEIAMDALVASQPDAVYILLGTNSLVMQGNDESFLNYYGAMLDMIREALDPRVSIYVQAIPGVADDVKTFDSTAGLDNDRIRQINSQLAALAAEKNCFFLDLQEALTNRDGTQNADLGAKDGIHYLGDGYAVWVDYLRSHVAYNPRNVYVGQNPYYSQTY